MTVDQSNYLKEAADILGSKWTPLIIAELSREPKRFSEIERAIPTLNPRTLSKRLDDLKDHDVVTHCINDPAYNDLCYRLTDKGRDLEPIIREMSKWGQKHPQKSNWNIA
jgi:DNA-binding HxlR family transcriptional regulator